MQAANAELSPSLNPGASYFVESRIVSREDSYYMNHFNNATCRPFIVGPLNDGGHLLAQADGPAREAAAVEYRASTDTDVHVADAVYGDGSERFVLGAKATDLGDGTWAYEYALHNYSSLQAAGSFSVPLAGASAPRPASTM